ncbi:hypothetical protein GUJ93_ZPchr0005g14266 [Zizania palustris]|uniref:Uncharacterized protein n=1 Tax=Zizania palustris TaxID=103762 RepID=A0A8J5SNA0_ZIZPA|nr:hypothetical protein GUJ93_ZPchr0005g14266 [Zizania palustris]
MEQPRAVEAEQTAAEESPRFRWDAFGSNPLNPPKQDIRGLSPKLPNRCKALMTRIVRLPPQGEDTLGLLLAFLVKAMNPKRADCCWS